MKLNVKRTVLIGFAFLAISTFWQMYDNKIPLMLSNTFGFDKVIIGFIMALDNIFALLLLPLFGKLSDQCNMKMGKRKPFILIGTLLSVAFLILLPIINNNCATNILDYRFVLFVAVLLLTLLSMSIYRSPAVALMPDVTPKPLRSKGNAIINLMGAIGGAIFLIANTLMFPKGSEKEGIRPDYLPIFLIVAGVMVVSLIIVMFFVNEPKLAREQAEYEALHPEEELTEKVENKKQIPKPVKRSLIFLLLSVAFWYIGYNAITTLFSVYAKEQWHMAEGQTTLCLMIAMIGAVPTYVPAGIIAGKIGRAKTIRIGALLLALCFAAAFTYTLFFESFHPILYAIFVLVGVAWAIINVNSFPMVVEMCAGSDTGKFTGYYYAFSMAAQVITPVLAGALYDVEPKTLFLYSAVAVFISFVTMLFVKHGDSKFEAKKGLEAFDIDD